MSIRRILPVTLSLLVAAACNPFHHEAAVKVDPKAEDLNSRWHATLATPSELAGAIQMNGSASMAPGTGAKNTSITLAVANATPGGLHPWEAHRGQCGTGMDNGVLGPSEAYKPVKVESDGKANAKATLPIETPETGEYFVVVHASAANPETIVACGNLAPPTQ